MKALVSSAYFPSDDKQAISQLQNSGLKNATDALVRGFIDLLIFGFLTDTDSLFYKPQVFAAINATFELYPALTEDRLRKQLNKAIRDVPDKHFPGTACLVAYVKSAWSILEQPAKDKVVCFIKGGPAADVLSGLEPLAHLEGLKSAVKERVDSLSFEELIEAISSHKLRENAKERAIHFLSQVRSWDRANEVFSKTILPLFSSLSAADIVRIIQLPNESGADLPGANGYALFINNVRKTAIVDDAELNALLMANGASYLVPQPKAA